MEEDELEEFYYKDTMESRMGDKYRSPIQDISEACQMPSDQNFFLLLGHKGCGKSTELNQMSVDLKEEGYHVHTIWCGIDLDPFNLIYSDLLILMGEALLEIAKEIKCDIEQEMRERILSFWPEEMEEIKTTMDMEALSVEAGVHADTPRFLAAVLQIFAKVKGDLKYSEENRKVYREKVSRRSSEWLAMLRQVSDKITEQLDGRQPIIVFEDLDKIDTQKAWEIFGNYTATLTGVTFPVIYTFPIALSYDPRFTALEARFIVKSLPIIKQMTIEGELDEQGRDIVINIVKKRANLDIFDKDVLEKLIEKTGGSLRDLFNAIHASAQRAIRRGSETISMEDAEVVLEELRTSLTRRIERKHYAFLADIYNGNHEKIEDKEMLLEMLQANTVLEYNGKRWNNVHPLVADFLVEQKLDIELVDNE